MIIAARAIVLRIFGITNLLLSCEATTIARKALSSASGCPIDWMEHIQGSAIGRVIKRCFKIEMLRRSVGCTIALSFSPNFRRMIRSAGASLLKSIPARGITFFTNWDAGHTVWVADERSTPVSPRASH
jgi:hypothetical protein